MEPPKVFASYSHDSDEHKKWVRELCTKLRENGVDVTLDEWDWNVGELMHPFMREGIADSDRVLVICTDRYVEKSNALEGGVGYETSIIDTELDQDLKTDKFIPIIRQSTDEPKTPTSLGVRRYIDFRNDGDFEQKFDELLHAIQGNPINPKPSLGQYTSAKHPSDTELSSHSLPAITEKIEFTVDAYKAAFELARADDILGWSRLVKQIRSSAFNSLVKWRQQELAGQRPENIEQLHQSMDKAMGFVAPLISITLVGVKSRNEQFNDQKFLLADLLNIQSMDGWNLAGLDIWFEIPYALGYVYHSLHGSVCLQANQLELAFSLAQAKFPLAMDSKYTKSVWENSQLRGYCKSLGRKCTESWKYLVNAYERWDWLSLVFADEVEYRSSLVAYYMALSIHELATRIASEKERKLDNCFITVPLNFLTEEYEIKQRATSLLLHDSALSELWTSVGVTQGQVGNSWETWVNLYENWLVNVFQDYHSIECLATSPPQYLIFFDAL